MSPILRHILKLIEILNLIPLGILFLLCFIFLPFLLILSYSTNSPIPIFYILFIPYGSLILLIKTRAILRKNPASKIGNGLSIIIFLISFRILFIAFYSMPLGFASGGFHQALPIEGYSATAHGGPSIKFFGGQKYYFKLSISKGDKKIWTFEAEVYPNISNWREGAGTAIYNDNDHTVQFKHVVGSGFKALVITSPPVDVPLNKTKKYQSGKIFSQSPDKNYTAYAESSGHTMMFYIKDQNNKIIWENILKNCSATIDWSQGVIHWNKDYGTATFEYQSTFNEESVLNQFSLETTVFFKGDNYSIYSRRKRIQR